MDLRDHLREGAFVVTGELGPPVEPDGEVVRVASAALAPVVDAANITDNQAASVKMSPLACATFMREAGLEIAISWRCKRTCSAPGHWASEPCWH
jgi:hypothetical protein